MDITNINGIEFKIEIENPEDFKVTFLNNENKLVQHILKHLGNEKVLKLDFLTIHPESKSIKATWAAYEKTPTGDLINKRTFPEYLTTPEDYQLFLQMLGKPIKKYTVNGLFRMLGVTRAVYDINGDLIADENQPVPIPSLNNESLENE